MKKEYKVSLGVFLLKRLNLFLGRIQNPAVALEGNFTIEHAGSPSNKDIRDLVVEYYMEHGFKVALNVRNLTGSLKKGSQLFSVDITNATKFCRIMCAIDSMSQNEHF